MTLAWKNKYFTIQKVNICLSYNLSVLWMLHVHDREYKFYEKIYLIKF